jgi:uncharacterized protein YndB with AHSA1/START domain
MAASNALSTPSALADRAIILTRIFDAPPEKVFEVWTDPKHLTHWYGPRGFSTTVHEMDVRPGGIWRMTMRGPDGRDYLNRIVFVEVTPPTKLVYKHTPESGSEPVSHETTVTFADLGGRTEVTLQMIFPTAEQREYVVKTHHAIEGGKQTLERLADFLDTDLILTRVFDAPPDVLFQMWTDVEHLKHWWGPKNFTNPRCEIDPRPGGSIRIDMRAPDGMVYPMDGTFQTIDAPQKLVFLSRALDARGNAMFEILNTVLFEEQDGKTALTLKAKVVKQTAVAPQYLAGMNQGWNESLDRLADYSKR